MLKLKNSLKGCIEDFKSIEKNQITMYVCGPTVYDNIHIGNARSIVVFDVLFRFLKLYFKDKNTIYVRNITDIDDKIIERSKKLQITEEDLVKKMIESFHKDCEFLNCLKPTIEPKVSEEIEECKKMIEKLIENNFAYESEGNVLFDIKKFKNYGILSKRNIKNNIQSNEDEFNKRNQEDFFLWKKTNEGIKWNSKWSEGRPGWHIECSAMATKYLGKNFDIHGGGMDIKFPHHENEIAQAVCCYKDSSYAKYWIHNAMLLVESKKMSKSLGNFITVKEFKEKDIHPASLKLALLSASYDEILNFNFKIIEDMNLLVKKIENYLNETFKNKDILENEITEKAKNHIFLILENNLDTSTLIKDLFNFIKQNEIEKLLFSLDVLGISELILKKKQTTIPIEIIKMCEERLKMKLSKNYNEADKIRLEIEKNGYIIEDSDKDKYKVYKKLAF